MKYQCKEFKCFFSFKHSLFRKLESIIITEFIKYKRYIPTYVAHFQMPSKSSNYIITLTSNGTYHWNFGGCDDSDHPTLFWKLLQ